MKIAAHRWSFSDLTGAWAIVQKQIGKNVSVWRVETYIKRFAALIEAKFSST